MRARPRLNPQEEGSRQQPPELRGSDCSSSNVHFRLNAKVSQCPQTDSHVKQACCYKSCLSDSCDPPPPTAPPNQLETLIQAHLLHLHGHQHPLLLPTSVELGSAMQSSRSFKWSSWNGDNFVSYTHMKIFDISDFAMAVGWVLTRLMCSWLE